VENGGEDAENWKKSKNSRKIQGFGVLGIIFRLLLCDYRFTQRSQRKYNAKARKAI